MSELEKYLSESTILWHKDVNLFKIGTRAELNELFLAKKIEVRNGINTKVVRYIK